MSNLLLGDTLICPICFVQYVGRVFQCLRGHTVCEICLKQLDHCPVCREIYPGTRNFLIEDLIIKLSKPSDSKVPVKTSTKEATDNAAIIAPPTTTTTTTRAAAGLVTIDPSLATFILPNLSEYLTPVFSMPQQTNGLFKCRMIDCNNQSPICRIYNHLRTFHKEHYTEINTRPEGPQEDIIYECVVESRQQYRHALQIPNFGLFFIIYETIKTDDYLFIMAWVQCVSKNNYARKFRFCMDLKIFNREITYSDYVHGQQTDKQMIVGLKHCLYFRLKLSTYAGNTTTCNGDLTVKIGRNEGAINDRRSAVTSIRMLPQPRITPNEAPLVLPNPPVVNALTPAQRHRQRRRGRSQR